MTDTIIGKQAVVIGASISGLAAAGALAGHFETVIVLERDGLPKEAVFRMGTPQDRHLHHLLAGGLKAMEELFPGFTRDAIDAGAVLHRMNADVRFEIFGDDALPQRDFGLVSYAMSRPLLEFVARRRAQRVENITIRPNCRVLELVPSPDGASVSGVKYETGDKKTETLRADLVIDASGRGAPTLALLTAVGRKLPEETKVGIDIAYSTAIFTVPNADELGWNVCVTFPDVPRSSRMAYMVTLEGDRFIVTLSGRGDDHPPGDPDAFMAYIAGLRTQTVHKALARAERHGPIMRFGFPESVWRGFERLAPLPRGLLPIGDSVCRFNPIYGQGMAVAAREARFLKTLLTERAASKDPLATLGQDFIAGIQPIIQAPWSMSAIPDFAYPDVTGQRPPDFEQSRAFGGALMRIAIRDPAVHKLMVEVQHLLVPPSVYEEPALKQRVLAEMREMAAA